MYTSGMQGRSGTSCRPSLRFLAACLLAGAACSAREDTAERGSEIVIGVIAPVASTFLTSGPPTVEGATLAAKEINAGGGVSVGAHRRRLRLVVEDTEDHPETAVSKAFKLIGSDRAAALIGLPISDSALAVARAAEEHGVPMISTASTNPETTRGKEFVFRAISHDALQGRILAEFAYRDLGARDAALVVDPGISYSRGLAQEFQAAFEQQGGKVTARESYTADDSDVSERLTRVRQSGADVLVAPVYPALLTSLMPQVRAAGLTVPALGGDSWSNLDAAERGGWSPSFFTDVWTPAASSPVSKRFVDAYREDYGGTPSSYAALAYDAVFLVTRAIELRADAAPDSIRAGLLTLSDFVGVTGAIRYEGTGDPLRSTVIMRLADDGTAHLHQRLEP